MLIPWLPAETHASYSYFTLLSIAFIFTSNSLLLSSLLLNCDLAQVHAFQVWKYVLLPLLCLSTRGYEQQKAPFLWLVPPLSWVCVSRVYWTGGWQSGAVHTGNGWHSREWKRNHPSKNSCVLVLYLIWGRQSVLVLNNGPTLLDQLPALLCDIVL